MARQLRPPTASAEARSTRPRNRVPTNSDTGPRGRATPGDPAPALLRLEVSAYRSRLVHSKGRHHGRDGEGSTSNERQRPGAPFGSPSVGFTSFFTPLVRKRAARPMTTRLEAWRLRGLRRNGTGRPSGRDVPGPAASRGTDTPGSVFEGSAMAPMRREPSLSRRKPRAAATGAPAGSPFLARREGHFLLTVGPPLAARFQRERLMLGKYSSARARTSEARCGE